MVHLYARHDHGGMDMNSGSTSTSMMGMKGYFHATIPSTDYLWFQSWVPSNVGAVIGACIGLFLLAVGERALIAVQRAAEGEWRRDALRRLTSTQSSSSSASSSSYKQPAPQDETIPAYNASRSHTASSLEKRMPSGLENSEIAPVLLSDDLVSTSAQTSRPPTGITTTAAAATTPTGPTYLPGALVSALTNPSRKNRYSVPFIWQNDLTRGLLMFCTKGLQYLLMLVVMTFNIWFITAVCIGAGVGEALFGRHGYAR
ncbi:hypothetical protein QFC21_003333 [Naganishia friedmannii]|uniref:Uncharacterized protein n=1 Tax=Naganishia friedmannii TaxID=89922 RepID=A0ACC2VQF5_9TREE|nr:hypothetical protein QFC21_003333 [Naganishia friedmannii]